MPVRTRHGHNAHVSPGAARRPGLSWPVTRCVHTRIQNRNMDGGAEHVQIKASSFSSSSQAPVVHSIRVQQQVEEVGMRLLRMGRSKKLLGRQAVSRAGLAANTGRDYEKRHTAVTRILRLNKTARSPSTFCFDSPYVCQSAALDA